jgi:LysM repeat protein
MCGRPVDSLPLKSSIFSGSWRGVALGMLIIAGIVIGVIGYADAGQEQTPAAAQRPDDTPTASPTITPTPGPTDTPTLTATPTATVTPTPRVHVVESGENPSYIAGLYGVTVDELVAFNDIDDVHSLRVGQELLIPLSTGRDSSTERILPPQIVYSVQSGDTLLDIALKHGSSVAAITAVNPNVDLDLIYPGQELVVPLATPTATATPSPTATPTPTPGPLYGAPHLLTPVDNQVADTATLLFNWTATGLLAEDEFYVLQLRWPDGSQTEHWTKSTAWRLNRDQRPAAGPVAWTVSIRRRTGTGPDGAPIGTSLTDPGEPRRVNWL